ncbi:MAG TPA: TonB family protein [Candidatus Aminicenantes bacterium]|nr:TonB family protein [Candidatus Aminicenantes bacterium]HRY65777.1 TonB family protein [Candidatus Aminicenantes bacterium]HRZ72691.1 TonB family protein [Candidatus Aminicenantes bacterium]
MKKILIIDYDQNSLASLQGVLAGQGYQVVTAADGQSGWDRYNKESPDLVLMEAMLPKVHGFELCQRITSERNSQATVFIMTGVYKDRAYRTEALRTYGAAEYFEKPLKMAELLASVEAVIGKPEPKPAEEQPARTAAAPDAVRRREKPRDDDSIFSLPEDLDRLTRDTPKVRKPVSSSVRREAPPDTRFDSLADELLKSVIVEQASSAKTVTPKPAAGNGNGNGNGNGTADIDAFLKTALAGLDLTKEKVKVPKTAPLPPPPGQAKPAPAPAPKPAQVAEAKPKVTPQPAPEARPKLTPPLAVEPKPRPLLPLQGLSVPEPALADMKNVLTPGDPGSDVSPFFTPQKPKPAAPAEKPRLATADKRTAPAEKKTAPAPAPVRREAARPEAAKREPARTEPVQAEPVRPEPRPREAEAIAAADIFQGVSAGTEKKSFPKVAAVAAAIVAVAAVGFILLRPKPQAKAQEAVQPAQQAVIPADVPSQPVETAPAPEAKPAPVKPKAQPKAKPAAAETAGTEAILPAEAGAAGLPPLSSQISAAGGQADPGAPGAILPPAGEAAPKTVETNPAADAAPAPAPVNAAPAPSAVPPSEGALVELASVTEQPKLVKSVNPAYPVAAQRLGQGGSITVNALIDERGNVIDTGILKGIQDDNGLGKAAENAVKKWKFQPARVQGVAVKVWKQFVIVFKPEADQARSKA